MANLLFLRKRSLPQTSHALHIKYQVVEQIVGNPNRNNNNHRRQ